ncbi:MAG: HD domain-containing protein, partial [Rhodanobacteraceae bacterium]
MSRLVQNPQTVDATSADRAPRVIAQSLAADERALTGKVCALLAALGCDDATRAAAWWYALARAHPGIWAAQSRGLSESVRRLVEGQLEAERVWMLHAQRGDHGGAEGLRRLLLAIIRDLRVVYLLLARQLAEMRAATALPEAQRRELALRPRDIHGPLA